MLEHVAWVTAGWGTAQVLRCVHGGHATITTTQSQATVVGGRQTCEVRQRCWMGERDGGRESGWLGGVAGSEE